MSDSEDAIENEPPVIDPYETLNIDRAATDDQIKKAYRKAALQHHPDKVPSDQKEKAHETFQAIAFAYAVLSDPIRRKRYDATGSTAESIVDSDGFDWSEYYKELYKDAVSTDAIDKFAKQYKGSDEEKDDILLTFEACEGDMDQFYESMILSDILEDDERYRAVIDEAIKTDDVSSFDAYTKETKKKRDNRVKKARLTAKAEGREAEEYAKELGVHDKLFGANDGRKGKRGKKGKDNSEDALAALILKNQQKRSENFLDNLAEKWGGASSGKKGKKRELPDEPSEEAFAATAARGKASREAKASSKSESGSRAKRSRR